MGVNGSGSWHYTECMRITLYRIQVVQIIKYKHLLELNYTFCFNYKGKQIVGSSLTIFNSSDLQRWNWRHQTNSGSLSGWRLHLHPLTEVPEVIKTVSTYYCKTSQTVPYVRLVHMRWNRGRLSFSASPAADRHSAASPSGRLGLDQHSCRGSRISPVFVSHSSVAWPLLFPLRSASTFQPAGTNPRLFWTRGHRQCGQPTICIPVPYLCQARGCCAEARPCRTDGALCAGQSGQTCPPLSLSPFYAVYTGNWVAILAP